MTYGMTDGEQRGSMTYPNNGNRAVDVPLDRIQVRAGDGIVTAEDPDIDYTHQLGDGSGTGASFENIRSIVIYSNVDIVVEDLYGEPQPYQAGWTLLQGVPESDQFTINFGGNQNLVPEEAETKIMVFNTPELPLIPNTKAVRMAKDNEITVDSDSWTTLFIQPSFPFDREQIAVGNTGSNPLDVKYSQINSGKEKEIDTFLASNSNAVSPGENIPLDNSRPAEYLKVEVKAPNGTTTAEGEFIGEGN